LQKSDRETKALRQISDDLVKRVDFLQSTVDEFQSYLRRDLLEIHGVPLAAHENTD
jgi:nitrogen fixation/metabolism regulation signal transduction histidine kinase